MDGAVVTSDIHGIIISGLDCNACKNGVQAKTRVVVAYHHHRSMAPIVAPAHEQSIKDCTSHGGTTTQIRNAHKVCKLLKNTIIYGTMHTTLTTKEMFRGSSYLSAGCRRVICKVPWSYAACLKECLLCQSKFQRDLCRQHAPRSCPSLLPGDIALL